jgi:hypothetical protein
LRDEIVLVENPDKRRDYPHRLRRIVAIVEIKGEDREMTLDMTPIFRTTFDATLC